MLTPGKDKGIASPLPLGLFGLAVSTFLIGFAIIWMGPAGLRPFITQTLFFGGLAMFLAGIWSYAYGDTLAATALSFVGVFNLWLGASDLSIFGSTAQSAAASLLGGGAAGPAVPASMVGTGMVFLLTAVVVLHMWIAAIRAKGAFGATMLFLWIAYGLIGIGLFGPYRIVALLGAISAIITAICGAYAAFAEMFNEVSHAEVLPLFEPKTVRQRAEHDEMERIRRLHAFDHETVRPETVRQQDTSRGTEPRYGV